MSAFALGLIAIKDQRQARIAWVIADANFGARWMFVDPPLCLAMKYRAALPNTLMRCSQSIIEIIDIRNMDRLVISAAFNLKI